jgi:hypothetical protein
MSRLRGQAMMSFNCDLNVNVDRLAGGKNTYVENVNFVACIFYQTSCTITKISLFTLISCFYFKLGILRSIYQTTIIPNQKWVSSILAIKGLKLPAYVSE